MLAEERLTLAWSADVARLASLPGEAERLERDLSRAMIADLREWNSREAEKKIEKRRRRHRA